MERIDSRRRTGRRARPQPEDTSPPIPNAFVQGEPARRPGYDLLDEGDLETLKARAKALLTDYGIVVVHQGANKALRAAGATPGSDTNRLKLPIELIEEALAATPKSTTLCGKSPKWDVPLPRGDKGFVMRTGTGAHGFVEPDTGAYRKMMLTDIPTIAKVANDLDEVAFIAHPFVHGVPELTSDIHGFASMVQRTPKHCWLQPYNIENVEFLLDICAVMADGEDKLRDRPLASCIVCSFSPLEFKVMDLEAMIMAGKAGLPIHACSLPSAGGTAPVTVPGLVLMGVAEIVAMVTLAHILAPGTPVIATPLMFTLDMRTGRALQSCVESLQAAGMAIQAVKRGFGLLAHTYGVGSDTPDVDAQSLAERSMLCQNISLSGADILGGVGQLECATVFSPVQAVLDNELGAIARRFLNRPDFDDEMFNWPEVSSIRAGGHFLDSRHTLKYCRDQHQPTAFMREDRDNYEAIGRRAAVDEARDRCMELMAGPDAEGITDDTKAAEIEKIVAAADRFILEKDAARVGGREVI